MQQDGTISYRDGSHFTAAPNAVEQELKAARPQKRKRQTHGAVPGPPEAAHQPGPLVSLMPAQQAGAQLVPSYGHPVQHSPVYYGLGQQGVTHHGPFEYGPLQHDFDQDSHHEHAPLERGSSPGSSPQTLRSQAQLTPDLQRGPAYHAAMQPPPAQDHLVQEPSPWDILAPQASPQQTPGSQAQLASGLQHVPAYHAAIQPPPARDYLAQQSSPWDIFTHQAAPQHTPMQQAASQHTAMLFHDIPSGNNPTDCTSAEDTAAENLPAQNLPAHNEREEWEDLVTYSP